MSAVIAFQCLNPQVLQVLCTISVRSSMSIPQKVCAKVKEREGGEKEREGVREREREGERYRGDIQRWIKRKI